MRPLVGISLCLDDQGRWRRGRRYVYADESYARAVEAAGGVPIHLPLQADPSALVEGLDALVIPGGDDLPPPREALYPPKIRFDLTPADQIAFDRGLVAAAWERGLPTLGICYGMQLLALGRGGSLHYHLPLDLPDAGTHRLPELDGRHAVEVEEASRLSRIMGTSGEVNSLHHQAVSSPGEGLRISARCGDGVIEAIEASDERFALGVQWHPEKLEGSAGAGLFAALVAACKRESGSTREC